MLDEKNKHKLNSFPPLHSVLDYKILRLLIHYPYKLFYYYIFKKWVYKRTKKGIVKRVSLFFDKKMNIMLPASLDIFFFGLKSHPSEVSLAKYMVNNLSDGDTMIDIGAHFGYYTLLASELVGNNGRVVSIEASPETFKILKLNAEGRSNVEINNMAMSNLDNQKIKFCVFPIFFSELNTLKPDQYSDSEWYHKEKGQIVEVPATTISSLIKNKKLDPKIIKVDVEGAEDIVMKGAVEALSSSNSISIIMEYVNDSKSADPYLEAEDVLRRIGYQPNYINLNGQLEKIKISVLDFMKKNGYVSENIVFQKENI